MDNGTIINILKRANKKRETNEIIAYFEKLEKDKELKK